MYELNLTNYPGTFNQKYKTILNDSNLSYITKEKIPDEIIETFKDRWYKTAVNTKPIILYRVWGKVKRGDLYTVGADYSGSYATTEFAESKIDVKLRLSLNPKWKNPRLYECKILVPSGTKLNIGTVAPITLDNGTIFDGGADQIILPRRWPNNWIVGCREVTPNQIDYIPEYPLDYLKLASLDIESKIK